MAFKDARPQLIQDMLAQQNPDLANAAAALGYDPKPAYSSYLQAWYRSDPAGISTPPPFSQWVSDAVHSSGTFGVANVIKSEYELATGQTLPSSVYTQIIDIVRSQPDSVQQQLVEEIRGELTSPPARGQGSPLIFQPGSGFKSLVDSIGPLQDLLYNITGGTLGSVHLTDAQRTQNEVQNAVRKKFLQTFGRMPSDAQVKQLAGMDEASLSNYYDAQSYHGTTYGQYKAQKGALLNVGWMTWFGHDPSDNDIKWSIGKSPEDLQARIDDSPYNAIPGMRIGEYKAYSTAGDDLSHKLFGYNTPDHLISLMRDAGVKP